MRHMSLLCVVVNKQIFPPTVHCFSVYVDHVHSEFGPVTGVVSRKLGIVPVTRNAPA